MTKRKSWPYHVERYYYKLYDRSSSLVTLTQWLIDYALGRRQNTARLKEFLPRLERRARAINRLCREVEKQKGDKRWPNCAAQALWICASESQRATVAIKEAGEFLSMRHIKHVERRLLSTINAAEAMLAALDEVPHPQAPAEDELIHEAETIAARRWERG